MVDLPSIISRHNTAAYRSLSGLEMTAEHDLSTGDSRSPSVGRGLRLGAQLGAEEVFEHLHGCVARQRLDNADLSGQLVRSE